MFEIDLPPDALARLIVQAAAQAQEQGYRSTVGDAADDATRHLVRYLALLLTGDDDVHPRELQVFGRAFEGATGREPTHDEVRAAAMEAMETTNDPDALHAFLGETPAFLRGILEMDRERGTRNADQVVAALGGLALAVLAADGQAAPEEDSILTIHLNHLRGELDAYGVSAG